MIRFWSTLFQTHTNLSENVPSLSDDHLSLRFFGANPCVKMMPVVVGSLIWFKQNMFLNWDHHISSSLQWP